MFEDTECNDACLGHGLHRAANAMWIAGQIGKPELQT